MTDIQLGDLMDGTGAAAEEAAEQATEAAAEANESQGEFLLRALEMLDEKGMLDTVLFGPEAAPPRQQQEAQAAESGGEQPAGQQLDAEAIADVGKAVIDKMGDVPISEIVIYAEENPEQVNQMIEQHIGDL